MLLSLKENVTDAQMAALRLELHGDTGEEELPGHGECFLRTSQGWGAGYNPNPHPLHCTLRLLFKASSLIFILMLYGMGYGFPPFIDDGTEAQ